MKQEIFYWICFILININLIYNLNRIYYYIGQEYDKLNSKIYQLILSFIQIILLIKGNISIYLVFSKFKYLFIQELMIFLYIVLSSLYCILSILFSLLITIQGYLKHSLIIKMMNSIIIIITDVFMTWIISLIICYYCFISWKNKKEREFERIQE